MEKAILLVLLYKTITLIVYGGQQYSSNYIERFVWEGLIYLGISIFFLFKLNIRNIFIYIPTAAFWAVGYLWLLKTGYKVNSPDLWNLYIRKILALSTLIPVATDALFKKRFANFRELNWVKIALFGLFFIGIFFG